VVRLQKLKNIFCRRPARTTIQFLKSYHGVFIRVRNGSERLKRLFYVRNGSITPKEEEFAKQTQVMLLGGWSTDDMTAVAYPVSIKLEALLRRHSWKTVLQIYNRISYGLDGPSRSPNHAVISRSAACTSCIMYVVSVRAPKIFRAAPTSFEPSSES
jgi:hypothetical protein